MSTSTGHSLWLVPDGDARAAFAGTIVELAREHGGPRFEPHVTVLGRLAQPEAELRAIIERLAGRLPPMQVELDGFGSEPAFFRSLYAVVRSTPAVLRLYEAACRAFEVQPSDPYRPHLSLLYGEQPEPAKQQIVQALGGMLPSSFAATAIELHLTTGPAHAWHRVLRAQSLARPCQQKAPNTTPDGAK